MSAQHIQGLSPVPVTPPLGAVWAAQAAVWLVRRLRSAGAAVWQALEEHGARRAARELQNIAQRWESRDPALARALRLASAAMQSSPRNRPTQPTHKETL